MKTDTIKKLILPPGPILSLTLIGLLLLSAILYYRAVKIQRFLEPALAFSQPRINFSQKMNSLLVKEIGRDELTGIRWRPGSILVDESLLLRDIHSAAQTGERPVLPILKKLGSFFMAALDNPDVRGNISLILVSERLRLGPNAEVNREARALMRERAAMMLDLLYVAEPQLEKKYGTVFSTAVIPISGAAADPNWIEFRIIPTERLHMEALQRLEKYMQ